MIPYFTAKSEVQHSCPKTAIWIGRKNGDHDADSENEKKLMEIENPIRREFLADNLMFYPVMIRGEHNHVYELSDIIKHLYTSNSKSPTTRNRFRLDELEPVRYPGFDGYERTIEDLTKVTRRQWKGIPDPDNVPSVEGGRQMPLPVRLRVSNDADKPTLSAEKQRLEMVTQELHRYISCILSGGLNPVEFKIFTEIMNTKTELSHLYLIDKDLKAEMRNSQNRPQLRAEIRLNLSRIDAHREELLDYYYGDVILHQNFHVLHSEMLATSVLESASQGSAALPAASNRVLALRAASNSRMILPLSPKSVLATATGLAGATLILYGLIRWQRNQWKAKRMLANMW